MSSILFGIKNDSKSTYSIFNDFYSEFIINFLTSIDGVKNSNGNSGRSIGSVYYYYCDEKNICFRPHDNNYLKYKNTIEFTLNASDMIDKYPVSKDRVKVGGNILEVKNIEPVLVNGDLIFIYILSDGSSCFVNEMEKV